MDESPNRTEPDAFTLLDQGVQRQLYGMGWRELRPIQAEAIRAYCQSDRDLLIMAETAGGKTEAAFLPVLSAIASEPEGSIRAVYVGPLKALINDQFGRLEELCSHIDVKVHRWHGDVSASQKAALVKKPSGVLLITPESLESLLINRTASLSSLLGGLRVIVIDEVHAFLEGERGLHLASLLSRIRRYIVPGQARTRTIGLSATVGDMGIAQQYLCPGEPERVTVITGGDGSKDIQFRIHGYVKEAANGDSARGQNAKENADLRVMQRIACDLAEHCRTHSNLIFANAKGDIEIYADMANEQCRLGALPETFLVHHGSLAREVREDAESTMKSGRKMTTVCSSTLEMGIDIGSVRMVCQIGAPWSVSSFKQRLGRSGRKDGEPRRLRGYVICEQDATEKDPLAQLPIDLLQTIAICELMLTGWVEPPSLSKLDLSTITHQVISTIAELGAVGAESLHALLCCDGPFRAFDPILFLRVLRELGNADIVEQCENGDLILGLVGEHLRSKRDFYAAFASRVEYTLIAGDRKIGSIPIDTVPKLGEHLVFAARRWQVAEVDSAKLIVHVVPAKKRQRPKFTGGVGEIHSRVREQMMSTLASVTVPTFLDATAADALRRARLISKEHDLARRGLVDVGDSRCFWLTWTGTKRQRTLVALLTSMGIEATDRRIAIECRTNSGILAQRLHAVRERLPGMLTLAESVVPKQFRKYDYLFSDALLNESLATDRLELLEPEMLLV